MEKKNFLPKKCWCQQSCDIWAWLSQKKCAEYVNKHLHQVSCFFHKLKYFSLNFLTIISNLQSFSLNLQLILFRWLDYQLMDIPLKAFRRVFTSNVSKNFIFSVFRNKMQNCIIFAPVLTIAVALEAFHYKDVFGSSILTRTLCAL